MPRFTQPDFAFLSGKTFRAPSPGITTRYWTER